MGCDDSTANPAELIYVYDRNVDARWQLQAMAHVRDTLLLWHIEQLSNCCRRAMGYYHQAESESGLGWNYIWRRSTSSAQTRFSAALLA